MLNIPTDLLRTLVAVVELRSFTRAAVMLGVTQPAVSAQIKRLQFLLGGELLDKSAPGVTLTPRGEVVVEYARRLLSINDQILHLASSRPSSQMLRIGIPADFAGARIASVLAKFHIRRPDVRFNVRSGQLDDLMRELRGGDLDVVVGIVVSQPAYEPRHFWTEEAVWIRSEATNIDPKGPIPLVSRGEGCPYHQAAVSALYQAGRDFEFVFTAPSLVALQTAVAVGFGTMVLIRSMMDLGYARNVWTELQIWEDAPLPKLPQLYCGIYLREGANREALEQLADDIAVVLRSPTAEGQGESRASLSSTGFVV